MDKIQELFSLAGSTVVVTGASSGLGLSQAILLAEWCKGVWSCRSGKVKTADQGDIYENII